MDYRDCDLVEIVPGRMSGEPVVRGTRVPVEAIEIGQEIGQTPEELAYDFDLKLDDVRKLFAYISKHNAATGQARHRS